MDLCSLFGVQEEQLFCLDIHGAKSPTMKISGGRLQMEIENRFIDGNGLFAMLAGINDLASCKILKYEISEQLTWIRNGE